ncbi:MAG: DUF3386 domain-containing protein [Cyanobacteria bacterium J06559_3]
MDYSTNENFKGADYRRMAAFLSAAMPEGAAEEAQGDFLVEALKVAEARGLTPESLQNIAYLYDSLFGETMLMLDDPESARELFRLAYENRYTWDAAFPGYACDVAVTLDGKTHTAKVKVDTALRAAVSGLVDESAQRPILSQFWEVAIHRKPVPFEEAHKADTFSFSKAKTLEGGSVEIIMNQDDRYHVRNDEIIMVHRQVYGVILTVHTLSSHDTGEGYLPHRYDSVYHDPKTGEQKGGRSVFEDTYKKVGDYTILSERKIQLETKEGGTEEQLFQFSNIHLLPTASWMS